MHKNQTGALIGAIFGLVFVLANAGALPSAAAILLRVLAILAFLRLFSVMRRNRPAATGAPEAVESSFGRGYRLVVAAEVVAGAGGLFVLSRVLYAPQAAVGWIALVVGVHFFGLAAVWRRPALNALAAAMSLCGAAGLVLAWADAPVAVIRAVAGIAPGALLLGSVWWSVRPQQAVGG